MRGFFLCSWLLILALGVAAGAAFGQPVPVECPPQAASCKIVVITPEEENTLTAPNMLFDAAVYANRMNFSHLVEAWKQKLATSPPGTVKEKK